MCRLPLLPRRGRRARFHRHDQPVEAMNALHAQAHWEFDGIWNAVATDPELWVGIITDPDERAIAQKAAPISEFQTTARRTVDEVPALVGPSRSELA